MRDRIASMNNSMFDGRSLRCVNLPRLMITIGLFLPSTVAQTQATQPNGLDYATLLKKASERPLAKMVLKSPSGKPLSDEQRAEIENSNKLMADAKSSREKSDFSAAASQSQKAFEIRNRILGPRHFLTISAKILAQSMDQWGRLPPEKQQKLSEADKKSNSANALYEGGDYRAAQEDANKALSLYEAVLPKDNAEIGTALLLLSKIKIDLRAYDEADETLRRAVRITERAYGENHPQTALTLDRVGWLRFFQARQGGLDRTKALASAEALDKAVSIFLATVGENGDYAESLDNLGTTLATLGKDQAQKAKEYKLRALVVRREVLGPEAKDTGVSLSNLAWTYEQLGEDDKVVPMRKQALAIFEKSLGPEHAYCYLERSNLARVYQVRKQYDEAIKLHEAMVKLDEDAKLSPETVGRLAGLGAAYLRAGRITDGIRTFSRTHEKARAIYTDGHQQAAINILQNMARICEGSRLFDEAVKLLEQAVEWDKQSGTNDEISPTLRVRGLGSLYIQVGRLEEARELLTKSLDRIRKLAGKDQRSLTRLMIPLYDLAIVHERLGDLDEAEKLCEEVLRLCESYLGSQNPLTARAMIRLGRINTLKKRYEMARFLLKDAERIFKSSKEPNLIGDIESLREQAQLHAAEGETEKAITLLRKALQRCDEYPEQVDIIHRESMQTEILKELLDASDSDAAAKTDRQAWRKQLMTLLGNLKAKKALNAKQKEWMKAPAN